MKMKKSLVPLFFFLLIGCSNDGFESEKVVSSQKDVWCKIDDKCLQISKNLCDEMEGITPCGSTVPGNDVSSSSANVASSSSSRAASSSSVNAVSSSSSVVASSSSSIVASSSSSSVVASSSSNVVVSSSSEDDVSSSSIGDSSSSIVVSSSSNLPAPSLGECSPFPYYVATTQKESIDGLVPIIDNYDRCQITYTLSSSSGGIPGIGSSITITSTNGNDSLRFASASSTARNIIITATATCTGFPIQTKTCSISVIVASKFADKIETCDNPRVSVGPGPTVVEINCIKDGKPAKNFGCDNRPTDNVDPANFGPDDVFTLNGIKPTINGQSGWATIAIPDDLANKESKRVLIDYDRGIRCVAH
jgi:hypothetical protein